LRALILALDAFGGRGGIAKFNRDLITGLAEYDEDSEVIVVPRNGDDFTQAVPGNVSLITSALNKGKSRYLSSTIRAALGRPRSDIIFCAHINLAPIAWALGKLIGVPTVLVIHGVEAWRPPKKRLNKWAASRMGSVIAVSETTKNRFISWSNMEPERVLLLPNTIDLDRFTPGPKSADLLEKYGLHDRTIIMTLARLDPTEKDNGIDQTLDAIPQLSKREPRLCYLICGDGTDRSRLEDKASALGISNRVIFTGYVPETEKVQHYRLADVFSMPSYREGFGIVFLEAMASGVPVVASKIDGSREAVLEGELGEMVDPNDPADVCRGISAALERPRGVRPKGLEHFSDERFVKRLHRIVCHRLPSASP